MWPENEELESQEEEELRFLHYGDWLMIKHGPNALYSEDFKSSFVSLKPSKQLSLISTIFIVQPENKGKSKKEINYGSNIYLIHLLSGKYLSYAGSRHQEDIFLVQVQSSNCQFIIEPLFECQTQFDRRIREGEECRLQSPAGFKMTLGFKGDELQYVLQMKKYDSSILSLYRTNFLNKNPRQITNATIYQICNVESGSNLSAIKDAVTDDISARFQKGINDYVSYVMLEPVDKLKRECEQLIQFSSRVFLKYYACRRFFSFDKGGNPCLVGNPNDSCVFVLENYNTSDLLQDYPFKMKHVKSGKYLSFFDGKVGLDDFKLKSTFALKRVRIEDIRITLFINQIYCSLQSVYSSQKGSGIASLEGLFTDIVNFIYPAQSALADFLGMSGKLKLGITRNEQDLLASVGFLDLLTRLGKKFIEQRKHVKVQFEGYFNQLICQTMMIVAAICLNNEQNTQIFCLQLCSYYESVGHAQGVVECLFHIFSNNRGHLSFLEGLQHPYQRQQVKSIEVLIHIVAKKTFTEELRMKIIKLLECFVIVDNRQKMLVHQAILLRAFQDGRLSSILYQVVINPQAEMFITIHGHKEEFTDLLSMKGKFKKELEVLTAQIHFICSLCYGSNINNMILFRTFMPEATLHKYFKSHIEPDYRLLLLRALTDVYLQAQIVSFSTNLVVIREEEREEEEEQGRIIFRSDYVIIEKIQNILLEVTQKAIQNEIIDSSLYMNIKTLRILLQLEVLEPNQVVQFKVILQQFIRKYYDKNLLEEQLGNLIIEILRIFMFYESLSIDDLSRSLILHFHTLTAQDGARKQQRVEKAIQFAEKFISREDFFNAEKIKSEVDFLPLLIEQSMLQKSEFIFYEASLLYQHILDRDTILLRSLKDKVVLNSEWGDTFYRKILSLKGEFMGHLSKYSAKGKDFNLSINSFRKTMEDINSLFYDFSSVPEDSSIKISPFTQNLMREFNVMNVVTEFISDYQKDIKDPLSAPLFAAMFDFLLLFIDANQTNLVHFNRSFSSLQGVFFQEDIGQSKLLHALVRTNYSRVAMADTLFDCTILILRHSPNLYAALSLLHQLHNQYLNKINQVRLSQTADLILKDDSFLSSILKIDTAFQISDETKENFDQSFSLYMCLIVHSFLLVLEHSEKRVAVGQALRKKVPLQSILKWLLWTDIIDSLAIRQFTTSLLKNELINLMHKIYQQDLRESKHVASIKDFIDNLNQKVIYCKIDLASAKDALVDQIISYESSHLAKACHYTFMMLLKDQAYSKKIPQFLRYFDPIRLIIVSYYPLMLKMLDALLNNSAVTANQPLKRELQDNLPSMHRRLKDFLQNKLTQSVYLLSPKDYNDAITYCEEILVMKLGFSLLNISEKTSMEVEKEKTSRIYKNEKIHNVVDNCIYASSPSEKIIYQVILKALYQDRIGKFLAARRATADQKFESKNALLKIYALVSKFISDDIRKVNAGIRMFLFYARDNPHLIDFIQEVSRTEYLKLLQIMLLQDDPTNQTLREYFVTSNTLLAALIYSPHPVGSNILEDVLVKEGEDPKKINQFQLRLRKMIQFEQELYQDCKVAEQCQIFCESYPLVYQQECEQLTIQMVLLWVRNKLLILNGPQKALMQSCLEDIVELLKTYIKFIRKFEQAFIPAELEQKVGLCLEVLFHAVTGNNVSAMNYLISKEIWSEVNFILSLDDSWTKNLEDLNQNVKDRLERACEVQKSEQSTLILRQIADINANSVKVYGHKMVYEGMKFALQPIRRLYGRLKEATVALMKEFKHLPPEKAKQFFSNIDRSLISRNLHIIYEKHFNLFSNYSIASIETDVIYLGSPKCQIARNMKVENGVDLIALAMYINALTIGNVSLLNRYQKYRLEHSSNRAFGVVSSIGNFFRDLGAVFTRLCRSNFQLKSEVKQKEELEEEIDQFFYSKLSQVELLIDGQLYACEFIMRPECIPNQYKQKKFIGKINFVSVQLKLESIISAASLFTLIYQNERAFFVNFSKNIFFSFLSKHVQILRYLGLVCIYLENIILVLNPNNVPIPKYYSLFDPNQPFEVVALFNFVVSFLIFFIFIVKQVPLLLSTSAAKLKKGTESFKHYSEYSSGTQALVRALLLLAHPVFFYNLAYMLLVSLVLYNKLFVAILALDILFQLDLIKNLLITLWRPKFQIILTILLLNIIQYFFSIVLFYYFKSDALNYCNNFGECFGFIFVTTYKLIGGFVGYIYTQQDKANIARSSVTVLDLFFDLYVLMIYQVLTNLITVIIIDSFSLNRRKKFEREENLNIACLICNLNRSLFNTSTKINFKGHVAISHNIWAYFYYYHYVLQKPTERRTNFERSIFLTLSANWLPNNYAKGIKEPSIALLLSHTRPSISIIRRIIRKYPQCYIYLINPSPSLLEGIHAGISADIHQSQDKFTILQQLCYFTDLRRQEECAVVLNVREAAVDVEANRQGVDLKEILA